MIAVFIAIYFIHIQISPAIYQTFTNIGYLYSHPDKFDTTFLPMVLCGFRLCSYLTIEFSAMLNLFAQNDEFYIVIGFMSICGVIKDIDRMYYQVTVDNGMKIAYDESRDYFTLPIEQPINLKLRKSCSNKLHCRQKVLYFLWFIGYHILLQGHFYFTPYLSLFVFTHAT